MARVVTPRRLGAVALLVLVASGFVGADRADAATGSRRQFPSAGSERVVAMDSEVTIRRDGSIKVVETIDYDFAGRSRHGIYRVIPVRYPLREPPDGLEGDYERITPLRDLRVSASPGTPDSVEVTHDGSDELIRIGDADRTITGRHRYVISYVLQGVMNGFEDHDELYLNINGAAWTVPFDEVTATVRSDGSIQRVACFSGASGSTAGCSTATSSGSTASFSSGPLPPFQGMTVLVALPKGVIDEPAPIYDEVWSVGEAFSTDPGPLGASGVVGVGGLVLAGALVARAGRDRRYSGGVTDAAFGSESEEPVGLGESLATPVEFVPPKGIKPGPLGTLIDERADEVDVAAMIIDLAVRGYLTIQEVPAPFGGKEVDFLLTLRKATDESNTRAEQLLVNKLFAGGSEAHLGKLSAAFGRAVPQVQSALYDEVVSSGWYRRRPDRARARARSIGALVAMSGVVLTVLLAVLTEFALVGVAVVLIGVFVVVTARTAPARTAEGSAMAARSRGFRELFVAGEGERQEFYEREGLFTKYLPYAIVFGCATQWAERFAAMGLTPEEMGLGGWYLSPYGYDSRSFAWAVSRLSTTSVGSISQATHAAAVASAASGRSGFSSGGGFSGGGFGGGGGGSW